MTRAVRFRTGTLLQEFAVAISFCTAGDSAAPRDAKNKRPWAGRRRVFWRMKKEVAQKCPARHRLLDEHSKLFTFQLSGSAVSLLWFDI